MVINVEYKQYYARGLQPPSAETFEAEVEPFQKSLELTPHQFTTREGSSEYATGYITHKHTEAGLKAYKERRYAEAEKSFRAALQEAERFGPENLRLAQSLHNLAFVYGRQHKFIEAEPLYKRSLAIREKVLGPTHLDVGRSLNNLGSLYRQQGKYSEAEPIIRRAVTILEKALGPEHHHMAVSLHELAHLYEEQGKYTEAEPLFRRALAIQEKAHGPEHLEVAVYLEDYAALLRKMTRDAEVAELEARAKAIRAKHAREN